MSAADYRPFVERMIERYEGGYGWDAGDSGGPTKYGITCYDLAEHRHERMDSMHRWASLVRAMTLQEADDIYQTKYAAQCDFNNLAPGKDCVVFDFGVNSGSSRAIRYAQTVVDVHVDGVLGPETQQAINAYNSKDFINELCDARLRFLRGLRIWSNFGRGWSARVKDLRAYSLNLIPKPPGFMGAHHKPEKPTKTGHVKELRIPKAFGKGYDKDHLNALKTAHQS